MKTLKKFFNTIDRINILKDFIMFIQSILIVKISYSTNNILLAVGLIFLVTSVVIFFTSLFKYNKERRLLESLKSYIIDNSDNYKKSEYYVLNPINYKGIIPLKSAPIQIQNNLKNIEFKDYDKISIEKEKEYFLIKFISLHPYLNFSKIKNYISKIYYELGRDNK